MKFQVKEFNLPIGNQNMDASLYIPNTKKDKLPSVLIVHGRGSQKSRYEDRAEDLAKTGFLTLIFSLRGCGNSDGEFSHQTIKMGLEDVLTGFDYLANHPRADRNNVGVWGGSYGGYLVSLLTLERDFKSLILAAPAIYDNNWWEIAPESLNREDVQQFRNSTGFSNNNAIKALSKYNGPMLLIQHENDQVCPKQLTDFYFSQAKLAKPKKKEIILGLGHRLIEQNHRKQSNQITVSWFKETLI